MNEMTAAIHAGERVDPTTGALAAPIYQTATFAFGTAEAKEAAVDASMAGAADAYFYSRTSNPSNRVLEVKLAALEGAEDALACASGMGAISAVLLSQLKAGDHLVMSDNLFVITEILVNQTLAGLGIEVTSVDISDLDAIRGAVRPNTRVILTESVTNPYMRFADLTAIAEIARDAGAKFVVDNTFFSPALLKPLAFGADIVVHSATKYLAGHGDTVSGVVAGSAADMGLARIQMDAVGAAAAPFNSWLVARGMRTLPLRMRQHSSNGLAIAELLRDHPEVDWVRYVGLDTDPAHEVASKYMSKGFGGMISFRMVKGERAMATFFESLELAGVAVSLGDLHTLAYPMPKRDFMVRFSVGCEDLDDLVADVTQALDKVAAL
ncbi:MAG TPA: PLP-dependent aspartate aminotransferase family protein [Terrimesophilobacter sp.]|nr:PLP-dependent aspartate aminotransferase family protein [Terrimesophilobacter sp.]